MKALILANIGNGHYANNEIVPSCFLPMHNKMTVIDRQISLLNVNGFSNDDICVLFGSDGVWNIESVRCKVDSIPTKKVFSKNKNFLKEHIFDMDFFSEEDILIVEGNRVFDLAIIARLLRFREKNALVTTDLLNPDELDHVILLDDSKVIAIQSPEMISYPWVAFAGICKLSSDTVKELKNIVVAPVTLLEAIDEVLNTVHIKSIKYDDLVYGKMQGGHSTELTGGSYSKLNYRLVVKKEDDGAGRNKLINEIKWLLTLPKELKPYFSEVLEYDVSSKKVFYNVPYYGSRNLREHILAGNFDVDDTIVFLEHLLDWMFKNIYSRRISEDTDRWIREKHIRRVLDRLPECANKSDILARIIESDRVVINGKQYTNIRELYQKLLGMDDILDRLQPKALVMIHGDLHFQNILIYNETDTGFILVDPRGEHKGSDVYYDIGKLLHSFHGKYDLIHTDQFGLDLKWDNEIPYADVSFTNTYMENVYNDIYAQFLNMIPKYDFINNDPDWKMKAYFAEASHFCSVATFHIGKTLDDRRAIVLYLMGVKLINEFFDKFIGV